MKDQVFLGIQKEQGIPFLIGKSMTDGCLYRWEPIATKIRGDQLGCGKRSVEIRRNALLESGNSGLLPVFGPALFQQQFWLGWVSRSGKSIFDHCDQNIPPSQLMTEILPLIKSYAFFHRSGLVVGRPDWYRLMRGDGVIFMPDPELLPHLNSPEFNLPPGLVACHPPENFLGEPLGQTGDLYYLGLILYLCFSRTIPYPLKDGWPTRALLRNELIPLEVFRLGLNPLLVRTIGDLLSSDITKRPTAERVLQFLECSIKQRVLMALPQEVVIQSKIKAAYFQKGRWRQVCYFARLPLIFLGFISLIAIIQWWLPKNNLSPLQTARRFYHYLASPPVPEIEQSQNPRLTADFRLARKQRLELVDQLLKYPLAQVQKLQVVMADRDQTKVRAFLIWREWSHGSWCYRKQMEYLVLQRNKDRWEVKTRERRE